MVEIEREIVQISNIGNWLAFGEENSFCIFQQSVKLIRVCVCVVFFKKLFDLNSSSFTSTVELVCLFVGREALAQSETNQNTVLCSNFQIRSDFKGQI